MRWVPVRMAFLLSLLLVLGGCAGLPPQVERLPSTAIANADGTTLGRSPAQRAQTPSSAAFGTPCCRTTARPALCCAHCATLRGAACGCAPWSTTSTVGDRGGRRHTIYRDEPEADGWTRWKLLLLSPLIPEHLL